MGVEQRPEQPILTDTNNTPEAQKPGGIIRKLGKNRAFAAGATAAAFAGAALGIWGCGPGKSTTSESSGNTNSVATAPSVPGSSTSEGSLSTTGTTQESTTTKTTHKATTTTTEAPTTTTTEAPTTTTTEAAIGIDKEFISTEKTSADVTGKIEKGEYVKKQDNVPAELNNLFRTKNPGKNILSVEEANSKDGDEGKTMRATVTDKLVVISSDSGSGGQRTDFYGGNPDNPWVGYETTDVDMAGGDLIDIIPAASPEEPDTKDFYMRSRDPETGKEFNVRICLGTELKNFEGHPFYTRLDLFDLNRDVQIDAPRNYRTVKTDKNTMLNFLAEHKLSELIRPEDRLVFSFDGRDYYGNWQTVKDGKGVQVAAWVTIQRFDKADEARSLIQ